MARSLRELPANWQLRCCVGRTGFSSATTLGEQNKNGPREGARVVLLAERVGFEPTKGYKPLLVFKTSAFDHSATSPVRGFAPRIVLAAAAEFNSESNPIAVRWSE